MQKSPELKSGACPGLGSGLVASGLIGYIAAAVTAFASRLGGSRPRPARRAENSLIFLSSFGKKSRPRNFSLRVLRSPAPGHLAIARSTRRGGGSRFSPQLLSDRAQLPGRPIVHHVVRFLGERDQVPPLPGELRIVLGRPDMVHVAGLDVFAEAPHVLAPVPGLAEHARAQPEPALRSVVKSLHRNEKSPSTKQTVQVSSGLGLLEHWPRCMSIKISCEHFRQ